MSIWHNLLNARLSRRDALRAGAAAAVFLPLDLRVEAAVASDAPTSAPPFVPIRPTIADQLVVPRGYRFDIVRLWGDEIAPGVPFGMDNDFTAYLPIDLLEGRSSSTDGLLWINHESPRPLFQHGNASQPKTPAQIRIERTSVGGSIFRVQRGRDGRWRFVQDRHNRRVTGYTPCELTGPASGAVSVRGARVVSGSVANCSGGVTPWGTVLSCEENYQDYREPVGFDETSYGWDDSFIEEHYGWIVEVDPFDPAHRPRKHTAMGRFRHENVAIRLSARRRVCAYMGDDTEDACVYKFVSDGVYDPRDRAANLRLLERGRLYAADFANGRWVLLDHAAERALREARAADGSALFRDQAAVLTDARAAALTLGATPTDRPEDIEIHPRTGHAYISLTNNKPHGNFHGQIIRIVEASNNPEATSFAWDFFAVGGPQSGFSSPDNLIFDLYGNLWMCSDVSAVNIGKGIFGFQGNNSMFFFATEGPAAGKAVHFASGPVECELTGPSWTPDGRTMFLSVQHPGEMTESLDRLTSKWPHRAGDTIPRPAVVAITGFPGWRR
jgi:secreted PhoX family phosphatase